jgi:hypothetical protein
MLPATSALLSLHYAGARPLLHLPRSVVRELKSYTGKLPINLMNCHNCKECFVPIRMKKAAAQVSLVVEESVTPAIRVEN